MSTERGIAVVGSGPAGLAAAWRLAGSGQKVTIFEGREVGGRLRTEQLAGRGADAAVQLLSDGFTRVVDLAQAVGAGHLLVRVPGRDAFWRGGRPHPLRYGSVTSMASSGAIPAGLKVRLGLKYVPFLERHAGVLDVNDPALAARAGLDEESIAEWGRREMGEDFVELMVYPLLASYYGVTPEETGAGVFHALARAGLRVRLLGVRGGAGALAAAVAEWLGEHGVRIREGEKVTALEAVAGGVRVRSGGEEAEYDGVVVAVPAPEAARLVGGADWLTSVRYRSTATLLLSLDRPVGSGWFGLSIPRTEFPDAEVGAICVQEEKHTGVVGRDGGALVVVPTPAAGDRWSSAEPGHVLDAALPVVEQVFPGVRPRIAEARLVRFPDVTFVPTPGHFARVDALEPGGHSPRLALAGDYLVAPTVEGAVRSGLQAADRLMAAAG
jgi:protoporphyrinogen/coproporphyrinogen III oxidase